MHSDDKLFIVFDSLLIEELSGCADHFKNKLLYIPSNSKDPRIESEDDNFGVGKYCVIF